MIGDTQTPPGGDQREPRGRGWIHSLPIIIALIFLAAGGVFLLEKAERQARDTTRKHHAEDIEQSLYAARAVHGSFPPYDIPSWCGLLNDPNNKDTRSQVEQALRTYNEQYANLDKPFPSDPLYAGTDRGYFYWKRSPSLFELYTILEEDKTGERSSRGCNNAAATTFDYGITSRWREDKTQGVIISSPL